MDYGTLAQLSNPGQDPFGPISAARTARWNTLNNINQGALQGASGLANLNAQQAQMQNEELVAGHPGRMDQATLANMNAKTGIEQQPFEAIAKQLKLENLTNDERRKAADILTPIKDYADAYDAATTPEEKNKVIETLKTAQIRLPNGYIMGSDPHSDQALLYTSRQVRENAPALSIKRDIAHENALGRAAIALQNNKSAMERTQALIAGRAALAEASNAARSAIQNNKPLTAGQSQALLIESRYGNDTEGALQAWQLINGGGAALSAQQKLDISNKLGLQLPSNVEAPALPTPNKTGPGPAAVAKPPAAPKWEVGKIYQDKDGNKAKWNGSGWEPVQ